MDAFPKQSGIPGQAEAQHPSALVVPLDGRDAAMGWTCCLSEPGATAPAKNTRCSFGYLSFAAGAGGSHNLVEENEPIIFPGTCSQEPAAGWGCPRDGVPPGQGREGLRLLRLQTCQWQQMISCMSTLLGSCGN